MIARSGSTTSSNFQRTKSTTSVQERRKHPLQAEPTDPQTARTHALIAAHRAFDRSRASTSTDLTRTESLLNKRNTLVHRDHDNNFSSAAHLQRQRSTLQNRVPRLADTLQIPGNRHFQKKNYEYSNHFNEARVSGENYGAEPSSYRRLKRTRSLLTPPRQLRSRHMHSPGASLNYAPTIRTTDGSTDLPSPSLKLRLKRSFSFLRQPVSKSGRIVTVPPQFQFASPPRTEAVELARSQYLSSINQQPITKKPSGVFTSTTKRVQKVLRDSVRTGTTGEHPNDLPVTETNRESSSTKQKLRSVSSSLSGRMKKLFIKSKCDEGLPVQQLDASKAHFSIRPSPEAGFDSYLQPDPQHYPPVPEISYLQSSDNFEKLSQRLSQSGSCDSLSSKSKSRVTSWTNSTNGSISARNPPYDPKRLSIIKEDGGPHQPSCSAGRHIGGVRVFQQPLSIPEGEIVDSQRIYSALVKRIDEEQKQMEKTKAALKEIHDARDQDSVVGHYLFPTPTIRRVESKESASFGDSQDLSIKAHGRTPSITEPQLIPTPDLQRLNVKRRRINLQDQAARLAFDQCSDENKVGTLGYLQGTRAGEDLRKDGQPSYELDEKARFGMAKQTQIANCFGNTRFCESTDSVYSRTTNGGTNLDYISPVASTDDFGPAAAMHNGIATILQSARASINPFDEHISRLEPSSVITASQRGAWRGWMEHQTEIFNQKQTDTIPGSHYREHAQIDPEDVEVGYQSNISRRRQDEETSALPQSSTRRTVPTSINSRCPQTGTEVGRSALLLPQVRDVPWNYTPLPSKNASTRRSQSALVNQTNSNQQQSPTHLKKTSGLRKISPSHVAKVLRTHKSQPVLLQQPSLGKENRPSQIDTPSPVSTPGRLQIQSQNTNGSRQLRKGKSTTYLGHGYDGSSNAWKGTIPDRTSERTQDIFSARLSKPFDMDIPERNRPFDSTFLGKREADSSSRLSVAPISSDIHRRKTYGDLGPPPFAPHMETLAHDDEVETTALPITSNGNVIQRSTSGRSVGAASRRIVSNFLRGKRKQEEGDARKPSGMDSAFI